MSENPFNNPITQTKHCSKCKEEKPVTSFHRNKKRKDGYNGVCKACVREQPHKKRRGYSEEHLRNISNFFSKL